MPRGVKLTTEEIDERIQEIDLKIEKHQRQILDLKNKKKNLSDSKNSSAYENLIDAFRKSGKSADEILELIKK